MMRAKVAGLLLSLLLLFPMYARAVELYVAPPELVVRSAPFDVAPEVELVHAGEKLSGSDQVSNGWRFVKLPDGLGGYVPDASLTATAIPPPLPQASTQASLARAPSSPDRGRFGGLWVMPFATDQFQGAGVEAGYRYRWIEGVDRAGFVQNGYEPVSGSPVLELRRTRRLFADLEMDGRWQFNKQGTLAVGGGVSVVSDWVETTSMSGLVWTTVTDNHLRLRPLVGVTLAGPTFELSAIGYIESAPEGSVLLGVRWGRR